MHWLIIWPAVGAAISAGSAVLGRELGRLDGQEAVQDRARPARAAAAMASATSANSARAVDADFVGQIASARRRSRTRTRTPPQLGSMIGVPDLAAAPWPKLLRPPVVGVGAVVRAGGSAYRIVAWSESSLDR